MTMRVKVRLFAMLRQQAGWREREVELPDGATIDDAWRAIEKEVPAISAQREIVRFARNREYATADQQLRDGDELALIPPVAGGSDSFVRLEITPYAIGDELLAQLRREVPSTADGAYVCFLGQTRETAGTASPGEEHEAARHAGKPVVALEYEVFEEMALDVLRTIASEIEQRFGVTRLAIVHRSGEVPLGEASVVVCAAAAHRSAGFDAARYGIEELKARAPIWKSEQYADGSVWIGAPPRDAPLENPPT
ncbi:MAG TPA: molybdopterin converting factor subunit 1 [Candidatus Limnocylindrales bacterium]